MNTKNLTAERDMCSHSECSLGNLITDAMVAALRSDSTWSKNSSTLGIFPAMHLQPNRTISKGMFTNKGLYFYYRFEALSAFEFMILIEKYLHTSCNEI
jgi:hypothetical protein